MAQSKEDTVVPTDSVARIMTWPVSTVSEDDTLRRATETLAADEVGVLVVVAHGRLAGVASERDIIRHLADGAHLDHVSVGEVMTTEPTSARPDSTIAEVARLMRDEGMRHVLVLETGRVVGIVSVRDLLDVFVRATEEGSCVEVAVGSEQVLGEPTG